MQNKSENVIPDNLFERLLAFFPFHSSAMKSPYEIKKINLSHTLAYSLIDEDKARLVVNELLALNEELQKMPVISCITQHLKSCKNYMEFLDFAMGIAHSLDKDLIEREWQLFYVNPNFDLAANYAPSKAFHAYIDSLIEKLKTDLGFGEKISNPYIEYDLKNMRRDILDKSIGKVMMDYFSSRANSKLPPNSHDAEQFNGFCTLIAIEVVRSRYYDKESSRVVCAIFLLHYKTEYCDFLHTQLTLYGKKEKGNFILDKILMGLSNDANASSIHWASKKGAKIDLIRILISLYEDKYFELENGEIPSKELLMKEFGQFLHIDLKDYDSSLIHGLETNLEANLLIFEKMKRRIQNKKLKKEGK